MAPLPIASRASPATGPIAAAHPAAADLHPSSDQTLTFALSSSAHSFLQPSPSLHAAALVLAKRYLDPLATATSEAQVQRRQIARKKRKRGESDSYGSQKPLQLKEVHLDGFTIDQVWEQARRVIDASRSEVERSLPALLQEQIHETARTSTTKKSREKEATVRFKEFDEDGFEVDSSDKGEETADGDDLMELDGPLAETESTDMDDEEGKDVDSGEGSEIFGDGDPASFLDEKDLAELSGSEDQSEEVFIPDKNGLNDRFFSIDNFNRQSEFLEQQDNRGEGDGSASDEEDVDWDADPMTNTGSVSRGARGGDRDGGAEESEDEGSGPTFGNADLNGPGLSESDDASDSGAQMEDTGAINNTNDIKYADFFAPPPQKFTKGSRKRALPKTQPPPSTTTAPSGTEEDIQRTISAVRRDIFEDDLTASDSDGQKSDPSGPRSSHQKRQALLTAEIHRLEAASVAKRDWTLSGEARAADRPLNSLLEEDLDFERAGKPIPVITQEVSEDIEALIKRRILAKDFDEVIRRRPDNLATGGGKDVRRGRFELEDTKPSQSLAEMYEEDHLKKVDPAGYVDKSDEKLKREHAKIEALWKDVSAKLDALSSWHYRPKPPSADIKIVADVPTVQMEDARPAAGGAVGGESMLAPQEVYKAGENRDKKSEVVTGSGLPVGREEMSRDEKTRRRRREKERIRKAGGLAPKPGEGGKKAVERKGVVGELKKGGVRVIGKKGEIRDVEGKTVKGQAVGVTGAGGYKL